ncbi:MAG: hypothetical protein R2778_01285 [Saprospiraceae bacterium]
MTKPKTKTPFSIVRCTQKELCSGVFYDAILIYNGLLQEGSKLYDHTSEKALELGWPSDRLSFRSGGRV